MATPGQSSVKSMTVALRAGVSDATLPNNVRMKRASNGTALNYAISLEDYAKITSAARDTVVTSTPNTANTVVPLWNAAGYVLNLTTVNNLQRDTGTNPYTNLWADTQCVEDWKVGTVIQGFNGDAFQLVRAATGTATISAGTPVAWGGVDTVAADLATNHASTAAGMKNYVVTSDWSDITESPTSETPVFAGVSIGTLTADYYGWIQISGVAVAAIVDSTVAAGDVVGLDENVDGKLTSPTNEVVPIVLANGDGVEDFKLVFGGQTTDDILWDATGAEVQAALEALSTIGSGNVSVARTGNTPDFTHTVTFIGDLAHTNVGAITAAAGTTPGNLTVTPGSVSPTGSGGWGVAGVALASDGSIADVEIRNRTSVNRHFKRAKLFFDK